MVLQSVFLHSTKSTLFSATNVFKHQKTTTERTIAVQLFSSKPLEFQHSFWIKAPVLFSPAKKGKLGTKFPLFLLSVFKHKSAWGRLSNYWSKPGNLGCLLSKEHNCTHHGKKKSHNMTKLYELSQEHFQQQRFNFQLFATASRRLLRAPCVAAAKPLWRQCLLRWCTLGPLLWETHPEAFPQESGPDAENVQMQRQTSFFSCV